MSEKRITIAIDGPVGVGKGTLALTLAKRLNAEYLYTGGMYRALALACLRGKVDLNNEEAVFNLLKNISIELKLIEHKNRFDTQVFLDGADVSSDIFLPEVSSKTAVVAAFSRVRKEMVIRQKKIAQGKNIVVEGRDISTDVLPEANLKIYLTADINIRVERRLKQLKERGVNVSFEDVLREIQERDRRDQERLASPLMIVPGAYVLDTTNLTIEQTVEKVMEKLKEKSLA